MAAPPPPYRRGSIQKPVHDSATSRNVAPYTSVAKKFTSERNDADNCLHEYDPRMTQYTSTPICFVCMRLVTSAKEVMIYRAFVCLFVCPFVCLSLWLSVCPSVY